MANQAKFAVLLAAAIAITFYLIVHFDVIKRKTTQSLQANTVQPPATMSK